MDAARYLHRMAAISLLGVVAGGVHSALGPALKLRPDAPLPPPTPSGAHAAPALGLEITLEQAASLFSQGAPFVDARRREDYDAGHVEGAFWIAPETFMGGVPEAINFMDPQAPVVIYCSGGNCDASHNVATLLQQAGFTRCHVMTDGYPAWHAAGKPTASGPPAIGGRPSARAGPIGWLVFPTRLLLGGLFIFAGVMKLMNPALFVQAIGAFKMGLPDHLLILFTFVVPWTEILAGACVVLGFWSRPAAAVIALMLAGFVGAIASVLVRKLDVHCSCFGTFEIPCNGPVGLCHIIRNGVLLVMAGVVALWGPGPLGIERESQK